MNNVDAKAGARHITGEGVGAVKAGMEPAHHGQAHQPTVEAVERTAQILRRGVVLSPSGDDKCNAGDDRAGHQRDPKLLYLFLHLIV